jgi:hypothetical protein
VYRPPKALLRPTDDPDGPAARRAAARQRKDDNRLSRLASGSAYVRELRAEFSEAPEEVVPFGVGEGFAGLADGGAPDGPEEDEDVRRYEEANFVRLALSKKELARRASKKKKPAQIDDFADFDGFEDLALAARGAGAGAGKKKGGPTPQERIEAALDEHRAAVMEARGRGSKRRGKSAGAEDNVSARTRNDDDAAAPSSGKRKRERAMPDDEHFGGFAGAGKRAAYNSDDEDDIYKEALAKSRRSKAERETRTAEGQQHEYHDAEALDGDAGRRGATRQIIDNQGLKKYRKREDKNPRKHLRGKFTKAIQKRKSQVREFDPSLKKATYAGESTGIRKNLSRSTKFV